MAQTPITALVGNKITNNSFVYTDGAGNDMPAVSTPITISCVKAAQEFVRVCPTCTNGSWVAQSNVCSFCDAESTSALSGSVMAPAAQYYVCVGSQYRTANWDAENDQFIYTSGCQDITTTASATAATIAGTGTAVAATKPNYLLYAGLAIGVITAAYYIFKKIKEQQ